MPIKVSDKFNKLKIIPIFYAALKSKTYSENQEPLP